MAERRPLHQQFPFRSGLETGGKPYDPPLLPYELSLIQAIGCSEKEYKEFVRHAMLRQRVRPAEYHHIPNIQNTGTELFIANLVIGLLFTAASVLLAPKPPSQSKVKGKKLADQIGPSRFNQATSFDNAPSLAELNQPIPIPFGKRGTGADGELTGGLILVPALVWSRIYAYGAYQAYEGVYVAGEQGLDEPGAGGILLGTSSLKKKEATVLLRRHCWDQRALVQQEPWGVKFLRLRLTMVSSAMTFQCLMFRAVILRSAPARRSTMAQRTDLTGR